MTVLDQIIDDFKRVVAITDKQKKNTKLVRMKLDDKFLVLGNNKKTVWKKIGDAKAALRNHFSYGWFSFTCDWRSNKKEELGYTLKATGDVYTYEEKEQLVKDAYDKLLTQIEFVEVDDIK